MDSGPERAELQAHVGHLELLAERQRERDVVRELRVVLRLPARQVVRVVEIREEGGQVRLLEVGVAEVAGAQPLLRRARSPRSSAPGARPQVLDTRTSLPKAALTKSGMQRRGWPFSSEQGVEGCAAWPANMLKARARRAPRPPGTPRPPGPPAPPTLRASCCVQPAPRPRRAEESVRPPQKAPAEKRRPRSASHARALQPRGGAAIGDAGERPASPHRTPPRCPASRGERIRKAPGPAPARASSSPPAAGWGCGQSLGFPAAAAAASTPPEVLPAPCWSAVAPPAPSTRARDNSKSP